MRPNKCFVCYAESLKLKPEIATFSELLRTSLTIPELTAMLAQFERFRIISNNKIDWSLYNRIQKILQSKVKSSVI